MRNYTNRRVVFCAAIAGVAFAHSALLAQTETSTFDTNAEDFVAGPGGFGGFINANNTLGNAAGELGGTFIKNDTDHVYLADPTIGPGGNTFGVLTLDDPISGSGELWVGNAAGQTNGSLFFGHMTPEFADGNQIGVHFADGFRFFAGFNRSGAGGGDSVRGTVAENEDAHPDGDDRIRVIDYPAFHFEYEYDPNAGSFGVLTADLYGNDGVNPLVLMGTSVHTLSASDRSAGATVSAFGIEQSSSWQGTGTDIRLDNLIYSSDNTISEWNVDASGNWSEGSNWTGGVPNAAGTVAKFANVITAPVTVTNDANHTVGIVNFNNANSYTVAGPGTLTIEGSAISVTQGSHTISAPLAFNSSATLNVAKTAVLKTEHFDGPSPGTDATWSGNGNRGDPGVNDYGWSDSDNTGTSVAAPSSGATGAGELGGFIQRGNLSDYGFDIGSFDPVTDSMHADGVYRYVSGSGNTFFGFYNQSSHMSEGGDPLNFIGIQLDDGFNILAHNARADHNDRTHNGPAGISQTETVTWSIDYDPSSGSVFTIGGQTLTLSSAASYFSGGASGTLLFDRFGVFPGSTNDQTGEGYWDDITFSTNDPNDAHLILSGDMTAASGVVLTKTGAGNVAAKHIRAGLSISEGIVRILSNGTSTGTSRLSSLAITSGTTLDLTDNDLIVDGGDYSAIEADVIEGYNNGTWTGTGITSSAAATNASLFALGIADNDDLNNTEFSGQTGLDGDEILVKHTYVGDANLTGGVNLDDFNQFLFGFNPANAAPQIWLNGDFNYTGAVNLDDFNLFLFGLANQGGTLVSPELFAALSQFVSANDVDVDLSAVPEPSAGLLIVGSAILSCRRRKTSR